MKAARCKDHSDSAITPENYSFRLPGGQQVGSRRFVAEAFTKRMSAYSKASVGSTPRTLRSYGIEAYPATSLSFWIKHVSFREYQKIGDFWLPQRDELL
jgi:hypothetical protein